MKRIYRRVIEKPVAISIGVFVIASFAVKA